MGRNKKVGLFLGIALFLVAFIVACLEGPAGPAGASGENGKDGINGKDAVLDSTLLVTSNECKTCHNDSTLIKAKQLQWANSGHANNGHYDRSTTQCAGCHTSEGFKERITLGTDTVFANVENPTPQNCRTCHNIHSKYDSTDWNLRVSGDVKIRLTGETFNLGKGALCASCHQPRTSYPIPGADGKDSVKVAASSYGPHHGAQATMFAGTGGYEIAGSTEYKNSEHLTKVENSCPECHMGPATGGVAGGHTFGYRYEYNGTEKQSVKSCTPCHATAKSLDYDSVQTKTARLVKELKDSLVAIGAIDTANAVKTKTFPVKVAGAIWNYKMIIEDKSMGVHNYPYQSALLKNSIESLKK